jgi:acyl-coenzyme A thioesterase PaaI-like protein
VDYERNLNELKALHHSQCLFNHQHSIIPDLGFKFDDDGALYCEFACNESQQGYDGMTHGGVIAAIVDASMAQCLMGHGVVGYTTDLSIKYRKPVKVCKRTMLKTSIITVNVGLLYTLKCEIMQSHNLVVEATGRFFKVK